MHHVGRILAKALLVERFDEGRQWQFPGLLVGVIELSELSWIHAKLACHLNMSVRQAVAFAGGDPSLQMIGDMNWLGGGRVIHGASTGGTLRSIWRRAGRVFEGSGGGIRSLCASGPGRHMCHSSRNAAALSAPPGAGHPASSCSCGD